MKMNIFVPSSLHEAGKELRFAFGSQIDQLSNCDFVRAWCSIAYTFPGLHPDGFEDPESGWPRALKRFAFEAWRRAEAGEMSEDELYPCDAQWSGLFDRMHTHFDDETLRRSEIAAIHSSRVDG